MVEIEMGPLEPRHNGPHNHDTLKYGYAALFVSFLVVLPKVFSTLWTPKKTLIKGYPWPYVGAWTVVVSAVVLFHSPDHLNLWAKRLGRVTYALLPLSIFLSLRPTPLPLVRYTDLITLHKWLSRLTVVVGCAHGICYLIHFIQEDEFYKVFRFLNFLGVVACGIFITMVISSLKPVRRRNYRLFYAIHYPASWAVTVIGAIHARPNVYLLLLFCLLLLIGQIGYRVFKSRTMYFKHDMVSTSFSLVTMDRSILPEEFAVGSHVRLSSNLNTIRAWIFPTHPFTIASLPSDDKVKLLVKKTKLDLSSYSHSCNLLGPFKSIDSKPFTSGGMIVIAGGSGLSLAAPAIRHADSLGIPYKLVWLVRSRNDVAVLEVLKVPDAIVYVTGSQHQEQDKDDIEMEMELLGDEDDEEDEDEEEVEGLKATHGSESCEIRYGRPDLKNLVIELDKILVREPEDSDLWLVGAGPKQLVQNVKVCAAELGHRFTGEAYSF